VGWGWADRTSTGRWSSTKGHCGKTWRRKLERLILVGRRATRPRREVKTRRKEGAERAYKKPILRQRTSTNCRRQFPVSGLKFRKSGPRYRGRGLGAEASNQTPIGRTVTEIWPAEVLHARPAERCRRKPNVYGIYRRWAWHEPIRAYTTTYGDE
jgi:hypothetical protein